MNYKIKNQKLDEELKISEQAEGYLITITRLNNGRLFHSYFTQSFKREDILTSIEHWRNLLKTELPASNIEDIKVEGKKILPPRYRK